MGTVKQLLLSLPGCFLAGCRGLSVEPDRGTVKEALLMPGFANKGWLYFSHQLYSASCQGLMWDTGELVLVLESNNYQLN